MRGLGVFTPRQISNRASQFHASRAVICTRRQIELTHRHPRQTLTLILQLAKLPYLSDAHIGVADDVGVVV